MLQQQQQPIKKIAIVGGGLGGLALAHLLSKSQYQVTVFERDISPVSRSQGYYIGINEDGYGVLQKLFDRVPGLDELMHLGSIKFCFHLIDHQLNDLMTISSLKSYLVNRWHLRECLAQNLPIEWNKRLQRYEETNDSVRLHFEDGTTTEVDVVIGADGANSTIRKQRSPTVQFMDIGITDIGGTVPYSQEYQGLLKFLNSGFIRASGLNGHSMLLFMFENKKNGVKEILWSLSWNTEPIDREDYEKIKDGTENLRDIFNRVVLKSKTYFSHPEFGKLVQSTSLENLLPLGPKKSSLPRTDNHLGKTTRVTMLGDAIHPMTTHAGLGANTALVDALKLFEALSSDNWYLGFSKYEIDLVKRGHYSVNTSLTMTRRIHQKGMMAFVGKWMLWIVGRIMKRPRVYLMGIIMIILYFIWRWMAR